MWKWLHYIEFGDKVLCHLYCTAVKKKIVIKPGATDAAFVRSCNIIVVASQYSIVLRQFIVYLAHKRVFQLEGHICDSSWEKGPIR